MTTALGWPAGACGLWALPGLPGSPAVSQSSSGKVANLAQRLFLQCTAHHNEVSGLCALFPVQILFWGSRGQPSSGSRASLHRHVRCLSGSQCCQGCQGSWEGGVSAGAGHGCLDTDGCMWDAGQTPGCEDTTGACDSGALPGQLGSLAVGMFGSG